MTTGDLVTDGIVTAWYEAFERAARLPLAEEERTDREEVREALEAVAPLIGDRAAEYWEAQALAAQRDRDRLAAQVQRVRDRHRSATVEVGLPPSAEPRCVVCKVEAPCATVQALDGQPS